MSEDLTLTGLFLSSFLAATLLPVSSEVVLFGVLKLSPALYWPAIGVATLGNTLGGMSSWLIGRLLPEKKAPEGKGAWHDRALAWARRWGSPVLLAAWLPVIGDPLCLAAGWLRLNPWACLAFMAAGKFARYLAIAQAA